MLFLLLTAGLNAAVAANLLTNPGFESGITGWSAGFRGGTVAVVTDAGVAYSGANYISATGSATGEIRLTVPVNF